MRKLIAIFLSVLLLLAMLVGISCVKSTEADYFEPKVEILSPSNDVELLLGQNILVKTKLSDYTSEYSQVNYYIGSNSVPAAVFTRAQLLDLAQVQDKDAEFVVEVPTTGAVQGRVNLRVEALSFGNEAVTDVKTIVLFVPVGSVAITMIEPQDTDQVILGDSLKFKIDLSSSHGLEYFNELKFFLNDAQMGNPVALTETADTCSFEYIVETSNLEVGNYIFKTEMYSLGGQIVYGLKEFAVLEESSLIDFEILFPENNTVYNIGERIEVRIQIDGSLTLFKDFSAYIYDP
ncbi:MAG: hypothetical protein L6407_06335, partial [Candidatus Delongbacteria bacterium]|nr:hypothetical protein [Candidatus Delongbacteria bacterium]